MSLETEQNLHAAKNNLTSTQKQLAQLEKNKKDLELALMATTEERRMFERELLALREHLHYKATGQQINFNTFNNQSSAVTSPPAISLKTENTAFFNNSNHYN